MTRAIGIVPVRGGSKSIPLKNIKPFFGKPLAYWACHALQQCSGIHEIILATDHELIKSTCVSFDFCKLRVYDRSPENARDQSSTESVIKEILDNISCSDNDIVVLVQATSPLIRSTDIDNLLLRLSQGFDSVLTGVRIKRFFWDWEGHSLNYNYKRRPRRQDFDGIFQENGAAYAFYRKGFMESGNRLHGRIGQIEMSEDSAIDLDEPIDWEIAEMLMARRCRK